MNESACPTGASDGERTRNTPFSRRESCGSSLEMKRRRGFSSPEPRFRTWSDLYGRRAAAFRTNLPRNENASSRQNHQTAPYGPASPYDT